MKLLGISLSPRQKPLIANIRRIFAGGLLATVGGKVFADAGLPVPLGVRPMSGVSIGELANRSLHPNIEVGHASASYSANGQKLTINQTTDKAVLDWQTFNIGAGKSVQFVQPSNSSIALNNVHQLDASKIYGNLSANGQVYLTNANGFVFGKGSSVNVNSLVATNLKIPDSVFQQGIANVVDNGASGSNPTPVAALSGDGAVYRNLGNGKREKIKILVESGAKLSTAKGGRILLAAPEVKNAGTIQSPDGQVILAGATDKVYLQASDSADLRGLLVEVDTGGDVKNVGKILTGHGNTTMLGFAVSQQGVISANTSVALNGSVRLLAREGAKLEKSDSGGYRLKPVSTTRAQTANDGLGRQAQVVLQSGSLTSVELDVSSGMAVNEQVQPKSKIDVEGGMIHLKSGAQIVAHAGDVKLTASANPDYNVSTDSNGNKHYDAVLKPGTTGNGSRVVLEKGSKIDVSGVKNVELAMNSNIVDVELRNYELRDAPLQKNGILHGAKLHVDMRKGTSLADASGAIAKVKHSVFERSINAGSIGLQSDGDLIVNSGANLDVSGGYLSYLAGYVDTTRLFSNGRLFDIATADPNRHYQKILDGHHYETGYRQGGDAGNISAKAQAARLDGTLVGEVFGGFYQRDAATVPKGGELDIDLAWNGSALQSVSFSSILPSAGGNIGNLLALSPALFAHGINRFSLDTLGRFKIDKQTTLTLQPGGQFNVRAGDIDWLGTLIAANGNISLTAANQSGFSGGLHIGGSGRIDTSGRWINDFRDTRSNSGWLSWLINLRSNYGHADLMGGSNSGLQPWLINGGNIDLQAYGGLILDQGSRLSANGGGLLTAANKITPGIGGDIALTSSSADAEPSIFKLGATLSSYALQENGELSISADRIAIANGSYGPRSANGTLYLSTNWLNGTNFGAYSLAATDGALNIAGNTSWKLRQTNWQFNGNVMQAASGTPMGDLVRLTTLPDYQRESVDLSLKYTKKTGSGIGGDAGILIGKNAWIGSDWGANFSLSSDAKITVNGTLNAPAGSINATLTTPSGLFDGGYDANLAIFLGPQSHLNAYGTSVLAPSGSGLLRGDVHAGGSVTLTAKRGYIVSHASSTIDVSGTQAQLDVINAKGHTKQTVASAGGKIEMTAAEGLVVQGHMLAKAGLGQSAAGGSTSVSGGSISLTLNPQNRNEGLFTSFPVNSRIIHVAEKPNSWLTKTDIAKIAAGTIPAKLNGQAYISSRQITESGADNLTLASAVQKISPETAPRYGEIRFDGKVNLSVKQNLTLDAPLLGHSGTGATRLSANTVSLGSSWNRTIYSPLGPVTGSDSFNVNANLIDLVGATAIGQFTETRLDSNGDIRMTGVNPGDTEANLVGALKLAGNLTMGAREIYPTTFSQYAINVDAGVNPHGSVAILPAHGQLATPLSAAGQLAINAPHIQSQGRLLAPFGKIDLNASRSLALLNGSVTSVSSDTLIPFGRTQGDLAWLYPIGDFSNIQSGTPQKSITLSSPNMKLLAGASVNLNGGGDLSAFEFTSGSGGSRDVLDTSGSYAILPAYLADFAPYDPIEFGKSGLAFGDSIYLSAALGRPGSDNYLAVGNYVLLPAHYALLPNAFLVTPRANTQDMAAGTTNRLIDGTQVIAGYRYKAHTGIADNRWSGFAVEAGGIARTRSEYQETTASRFFAGDRAGSPQDAGNLTLLAAGRLELAAIISATAATDGLGGLLDIGASKLSVVRNMKATSDSDGVVLLADQLNNLNVDSLLLGGRRQRSNGNTRLTVNAQTVTIDKGVNLRGREILLAARDNITVAENTQLASSGSLKHTDTELTVVNTDGSSDGALLRVSSGAQAQIHRPETGLTHSTGVLDIKTGATLSSSGSILLDGSKDTLFNGAIALQGGDLTLSSSRITLGGNGVGNGLHLAGNSLNKLNASRIVLNSYGSIDFAGALNLNLSDLTLNSATLRGATDGAHPVRIAADAITLTNTNGAALNSPVEGETVLNLFARKILTLGEGDSIWSGFRKVTLAAGESVIDDGDAAIRSAGSLAVITPAWTANAGSSTAIDLGNHDLTVAAVDGTASSGGLGARLSVNARDIVQQGRIAMAAGSVALNATRDLSVSGVIDVAGRIVNLADVAAYAGGGNISLSAEQGKLAIQGAARLDVSGSSAGGDAGSLSLSSANGELTLEGNLLGDAYQGAIGGAFALDSQSLTNREFATLIGKLHGGGFNGDIAIRQRQGDLTVAESQHIQAANLSLAADSGKLSVAGELSVNGYQAGKLQLAAGDELTILAGAKLSAVSSGSGKSGGSIILTSTDADGDSKQGVTIASGARLDVSGAKSGGEVSVTVNRLGDDDAAEAIANDTVIGAANLKVNAMAQYGTDTLSNSLIKQWYDSTRGFFGAASANADLTARLGGFTLRPGLDIQSTGSLDLNLSERLDSATWTRVGTSAVWRTKLDDVAGMVHALRQLNADGTAKKAFSFAAPTTSTCTLSNCKLSSGTFYFDTNPDSSTYRTLFFQASATSTNPRTLTGLTGYNSWDFTLPYANGQSWHFGDAQLPGLLAIRAAENLDIRQSLSDGIARYDASQLNGLLAPYSAGWKSREVLRTGDSWSYQLVAGADLSSANPLGLIGMPSPAIGNVTLGANTRVRTGTGSIDIAAAGDIKLTDWTSAIYTMGRADTVDRYGSYASFQNRPNQFVGNTFFVEYPTDGGDVSLNAGGDIVGAASSQFLSDWLQHIGQVGEDGTLTRATAWGIAFDAPNSVSVQNQSFGFRENIGALGGGNINVSAGNDILDLSVMLPTSGKAIGAVNADGDITENVLQVRGGGDLKLWAGGDIAGGVFYVDNGNAEIKAGREIKGGSQFSSGPVFAVGDTRFDVQAGKDIAVGAVINPFTVGTANFTQTASNTNSYFVNYTNRSGMSLKSLAGNIDFNHDTSLINQQAQRFLTANSAGTSYLNGLGSTTLMQFYPGNLTAHALTGDIDINNSFTLYPTADTSLNLAAWGALTVGTSSGSVVTLEQLDSDPQYLLPLLRPAGLPSNVKWGDHADTPVHWLDKTHNRLIAAHGSIAGIGAAKVITAKATTLFAGLDLKNLSMEMQNLHAGDVSSLTVGRDIVYELDRNPLTGDINATNAKIELAGPGLLNIWAGRDIDLGVSQGITTIGNIRNVYLPTRGADITVLAGNRFNSDTGPLEDFLNAFVVSGKYQNLKTALSGQTTAARRLQIALSVLFAEIRAAAKEAAVTTGSQQQAAYQRGYDAIARLFPDAPPGDIKLFFSRIQTLQGGDINLLAPGGMVNVGLASGFTGTKSDNADLGIIAQREGDINILVKNDLQVNQQRVFTLDSGDITVWSSEGNIDAGRGAKSALTTASPRISIDKTTGQLVVEFPPTISGSGIRAQSGYDSDRIGDVTLVAPKGVIDAGEAGIGGNDITLVASAVIGASNIQALGNVVGMPQAATVPMVPTGVDSAAATVSKSADSQKSLSDDEGEGKPAKKPNKVVMLDAHLLGFGSCSVDDVRAGKLGCGEN